MRTTSACTLLVLTACAISAASAVLPASASVTTVGVTIEAGALSVTAPGAFELVDVVPGRITAGAMSGITVNDARAGVLGWTAVVSVSDFIGKADPGVRIDASKVTYAAGAALVTGTSTVTAGPAVTAPAGSVVQTATAVSGSNRARWDAVIGVDAPAGIVAGTYTTRIVHSVL